MRITFVLPYAGLAGGIRVVAIYANLLQQKGHTVVVVSVPKRPIPHKQQLKSLVKGKGWISSPSGPSHFDNIAVQHKILEKYRPIVNEDVPDADVVIATWWETAEWVNEFSPSKGVKYYFVQHHEIHEGQPIDRVKATYKLPLRKITISNWLVDIMDKEYGDSKVALVPNSVDHTFFDSEPRSRQIIPTVGFMLSPSYYKGCDIIIEALQIVRKTFPELKILVFGAHQPQSSFVLPANTEFYFQPSQETIRDIYSSCDFWIFGSRVEGFGLPLLEAMACRTPVIATDAGAASELMEKGGGILIEGFGAQVMGHTIVKSMGMTDEEWNKMSTLARQTVLGYTWNDAVDLFEKALEVRRV